MSVLDLVAKISLDTTQYTAGLSSASSQATSFGGAVKKGLGTIGSIATKALGAASTAALIFGGASVKTGKEFDVAMSQVAATMGKTSAEMEREVGSVDLAWGTFSGNLRDYAQEMGANTQFSAVQAAEALNYMALAGYDTQKSMETLPKVMNLAAAGAMDLARASDMVTDTESAFGLESERTGLMVDEMAKAASTGNTSVEQLGEAFLRVGGLAKELNGGFVTLSDGTKKPIDGITEMSIAMTAMANAGIKGSEAGTHMRNMIMKLSNPTKAGTEQMEALGLKVFDAEGNMRSLHDIMGELNGSLGELTQEEKIQAIADLFNARDLASVEAILAAVEQDWDEIGREIVKAQEAGVLYNGQLYSMEDAQAKFGDAIYDAEQGFKVLGAAEFMAMQQLDNLEGDMTYFKSALEGAQIAISDKITPSLREFVKEGTSGISEFTNKLRSGDVDGAINALGESIGNITATAVSKIPQLVETGGKLLLAIGKGIINNSPEIIKSVEQAIGYLTSTVSENAPKLLDKGVELIGKLGDGIVDSGPLLLDKGINLINDFSSHIGAGADSLLTAGIEFVAKIGEGFVSGIPQFLEKALPMFEQFTEWIRGNAGKLVDSGMQLILNIAQGIANSIPTLVQYIPQIVINIAGIINDNAPKLLSTGVQLVAKLVGGIISAIPVIISNIPKIIQAIVSVFFAFNWIGLGKNVITFIANGVKGLATAVPEAIKNIGQTAIDWFSAMNWSTLGADIIDLIVIGVQSLVTAIPSALQSIGTTAIELFKSIDWLGVGKFVVEGLISGISGLATAAVDAIKGVGTAILDGFKSLFGINSPSTVMEEQGNFLIEGLTNALTQLPGAILGFLTEGLNNVVTWGADLASKGLEAASNFATNVKDGFVNAKEKVSETVGNIKEKVSSGFSTAKEKVTDAVGNIKKEVGDGFSTAQENVSSAAKNIKDGVSKSFTTAKENAVRAAINIKTGIGTNFTAAKSSVSSAMSNIKDGISKGINTAKSTVNTAVTNIKTYLSGLSSVASTVGKIFDDIRKKISDKINDAKDAVSRGIEKIKDKFNFSWSLPKLKLPHFSVSGKFSVNPPSVPHFSIDWYKKAMDNPFVIDGAQIFGATNGSLLGGGEAGREIVVGEQKALDLISKASGNQELLTRVNYLIRLLEYYLPKRTSLTSKELDRMLGALL